MSPNLPHMIDLAQRYCELIEAANAEDMSWLKEIATLFPKLHAAVDAFDYCPYSRGPTLTPDLDVCFELYSHLLEILDDRDAYWLEFDQAYAPHAMTGSLADDLTDSTAGSSTVCV